MRTKYFKVYPDPENEKYFFRVCIFPTNRALNRMYETQCGPLEKGQVVGGYCTRYTVHNFKKGKKRSTITGYLGDIALCIDDITAEIVSHECAHAALGYMRRLKRHKLMVGRENINGKTGAAEEEFCYALGRMASQIAHWDITWNRSRNK